MDLPLVVQPLTLLCMSLQLSEEQNLRHEVEVCMAECQTEWEAQESQWQIEHEEEVRALRQRNSQLLNQLEDTGFQYQEFIREQEREVYMTRDHSFNAFYF